MAKSEKQKAAQNAGFRVREHDRFRFAASAFVVEIETPHNLN
jgi:hypothetical protein